MKKFLKGGLLLCGLLLLAGSFVSCVTRSSGNGNEGPSLVAGDVTEDEKDAVSSERDEDVELHEIFEKDPGSGTMDSILDSADLAGHAIHTDYDGDGIPNDEEIISNPFVADYPRIVTRISAPITMEIRISTEQITENYTETLKESDFNDTIKNSMEDKHYTSAQEKTTPYVTKESLSESGKQANAYGYSDKNGFNVGGSYGYESAAGGGFDLSFNYGQTNEHSENQSVEESFSTATMAEKTVFEDVDYVDNLDRNGIEFTSESVQRISTNFRKSEKVKEVEKIGPSDGYVRASLFLKNITIDIPARISNVICTLSFRTPAGQFLPVKTFKLRNDDYTEFEQEIYGGQELGPYTIGIENLNTREVMKAMANGYVPQVHVVNYDIHRVEDSSYNPGVDNLKIVEEQAKGRTATIKIIGCGMREIYKVAAFDLGVSDVLTGEKVITPGISLKKALFLILRDRVGSGELWSSDQNGEGQTVPDGNLKWKAGAPDPGEYIFSDNKKGNSWRRFETYVKTFVDRFNNECKIETIKRIDGLSKYNPFSPEDNPSYNPNELLTREEVSKMKFWVILHNGRYFEGDLNDPIWAGERYEIICMDMLDFNEHFENFAYTPFQSHERVYFDTRWNSLTEENEEFARAVHLGKVLPKEVISLEVDLLQSRSLFDPGEYKKGFGAGEEIDNTSYFYNFAYTFEPEEKDVNGIPEYFSHSAEGGINCIRVAIDESKYAQKYRIVFYEEGKKIVASRSVEVTKEVLEANDNIVFIDSNNDPFGGLAGNNSGLEYRVEVTALGTCDGQPVETKSNQVAIAFVTDAAGIPGGFDFIAKGAGNVINLSISDSADAEYFVIKCRGPYNYTAEGQDVPEKEKIGYKGFNSIKILNPDRILLEENSFKEGLYSLQVFARNKYCANDSVGASSKTIWIKVAYDRYGSQRRFAPKILKELSDLSAIDLEVNFNDGNGWFKLQTVNPFAEGGAGGYDTAKTIDCFFSSYMVQDKQKFFIRFYPPNGELDGMPNVFSGGREVTDVYIRTVADRKYRDTFWMRPEMTGETINSYSSFNDAERYLSLDIFGGTSGYENVIDYWFGLDATDATSFENTVTEFYSDGNVSTGNLDDYFFSPVRQHVYAVRGLVSDEVKIIQGYRPGRPALITTPPFPQFHQVPDSYSYDYIDINNVYSAYATSYEIYYIEGSIDYKTLQRDAGADETGAKWVDDYDWMDTPSIPASKNSLTLHGLQADTSYTVCAAARNKYGLSVPECTVVSIPGIPAEMAGRPEIGEPGDEDDASHIEVSTGNILIADITAENAVYFKAYWKIASAPGDDVASSPWQEVTVNGTALEFVVPESIWSDITVRIYSVNSENLPGPAYWEKNIKPVVPDVLKNFTLAWDTPEKFHNSSGVDFYLAEMKTDNFDLSNVPLNTDCKVEVEWRILEGVVPESNQGVPLYVKTSGSLSFDDLGELVGGFSFGENNCTNGAFRTDRFVLSAWINGAMFRQYLKNVKIQINISISGDITQSKTVIFTLPNLDVY